MALSIKQFEAKMAKLVEKLPAKMLDTLERAALDAKASVNERIVQSGKDASGAPFKDYTPAYKRFKEDVGRYRGFVDFQLGNFSINKRIDAVAKRRLQRIANSKTKSKSEKAAAKKKLKMSKSELKKLKAERRATYLPKGAKLWESIQLTRKEQQGELLRVVVAPTDEINRKKSEGLSKTRGDFLRLSESEQSQMKGYIEKELSSIIIKTFGI